jgi:hypothetical protein
VITFGGLGRLAAGWMYALFSEMRLNLACGFACTWWDKGYEEWEEPDQRRSARAEDGGAYVKNSG